MAWDWQSRGAALEAARKACVPRGASGHREAAARFHDAWAAVWPPAFFEQLDRCRRRDAAGVEDILGFIEACPRFFRSGYVLSKALRVVGRPPCTKKQRERMGAVVVSAIRGEKRLPMRGVRALARAVDSPMLRSVIQWLVRDGAPLIRARAWDVADALPPPALDPARTQLQREDDRVMAMLVTAQNRRSAKLLRRVLASDLEKLTTRGRQYVAVAFERAMNWGLLPDDELLEIARRIDGPEMAPIWGFGTERDDAIGERARWLRDQLVAPNDRR